MSTTFLQQKTKNGTVTLEQYFDFEWDAEGRHQFINGKIEPMAYSTDQHGDLTFNLVFLLQKHFFSDPLVKGYSENRMLYVAACNRVYYPDLMLLTAPQEFYFYKKLKATTNPTVVIEVLSKSTQKTDRNEKRDCYLQIETLRQYILIAQDRPLMEIYNRQNDGSWQLSKHSNLTEEVAIHTAKISLADIYRKVVFTNVD